LDGNYVTASSYNAYNVSISAFGTNGSGYTTPSNVARFMDTSTDGRVIIIQDSDVTSSIPNAQGGNISFYFGENGANEVVDIDLYNIGVGGATVYVELMGGVVRAIPETGVSIGVVTVPINLRDVLRVTVSFTGRGAVARLRICHDGSVPTLAPYLAPPTRTFEPSAPPSYYCPERLEPDLVKTVGANVPFPSDALVVVTTTGNSVNFTVTQKWADDGVKLVAVHYHDYVGSTVCVNKPDMAYDVTDMYAAYCYCGWTDVSIYVYLGDDVSGIDECDACEQPPDDDDSDIVAYFFELPCDVPCIPSSVPSAAPSESSAPSASPSLCIEKLEIDLIKSVPEDVPLPDGTVTLVDALGKTIVFSVTQLWTKDEVDLIAVHFHDDVGSTECDTSSTNVAYDGPPKVFTAYCYCGYTDVSIYVYFNVDDDLEDCDACTSPEDADSEDFVAYYFELPCEHPCLESSVPTASPAVVTKAPAGVTLVPSASPSECIDAVDVDLTRTVGAAIPLPEGVLTVLETFGKSVTFSVTQNWEETGVGLVAVHFHDAIGSTACEPNPNMEFSAAGTMTYTAYCFCGYTDISIYVYLTDVNVDDCEACIAPDEDSDSVVAYYFEIPCEDPCEPAIMDSPILDSTIMDRTIPCAPVATMLDTYGTCLYENNPIEILSQHGETVTFSVSHSWTRTQVTERIVGDLAQLAVRLSDYPGLTKTCSNYFRREAGIVDTLTAECDSDGFAEVEIFVADEAFDTEDLAPDACPGSFQCSYVFRIPCSVGLNCDTPIVPDVVPEPPVPSTSAPFAPVRRMEEVGSFESFKASFPDGGASKGSTDMEVGDTPYCVSEDFRCEGESSDMVFVCHYSARQGYQTFCIPETDSDILRFYPNDYCGPCAGGYGGLWN
jgi:hypothetical protein